MLASGRGSNLQALIDASDLGCQIVLVLSDRRGAAALERARMAGIETAVVRLRDYDDRADWDVAIRDRLCEARIELIVCAGFGRVLGPAVVAAYPERILNVHPALLPSFGGNMRATEDALAYGVKVSGCTVHIVDEHVDAGPIVVQRAVPVLEDDTPATLAARIRDEEHHALPEAVRLLAAGRLRFDGRRVRVERAGVPASAP